MKHVESAGLLAHYFNTATFSDVTIHLDNGVQVKAHRVILATHSEHIRKMFESVFAESSAREVSLCDDDPEALHGLLAWCYGLLYDGTRTFPKQTSAGNLSNHGAPLPHDPSRLHYVVSLHTTADKYMAPQLKVHAAENFAWATLEFGKRYMGLDTAEEDRFMCILEDVATLVYGAPEDSVKELRPALAKAVHSRALGVVGKERFKQLMVELREFCFDMLALGAMSSVRSAQEMERSMSPVPQGNIIHF